MEDTGASDKEAPPNNANKKDLMQSQQLEAISILRVKNIDSHFERGAIVDVAKKFNMACTTIRRLWQRVTCMHAACIINSPELVSWKKFQESTKVFARVYRGGCQGHAAKEEVNPAKAGNINGCFQNHSSSLDCCINDSHSL